MGLYLGCDARAGRLGLSTGGGLTREKSAGNPSEGAAAGKCSISHLDLSTEQCVDGADTMQWRWSLCCTRNSGWVRLRWHLAAPLDELWGRLSHAKVCKGHHVSPVWATLLDWWLKGAILSCIYFIPKTHTQGVFTPLPVLASSNFFSSWQVTILAVGLHCTWGHSRSYCTVLRDLRGGEGWGWVGGILISYTCNFRGGGS